MRCSVEIWVYQSRVDGCENGVQLLGGDVGGEEAGHGYEDEFELHDGGGADAALIAEYGEFGW